MAPLRFRSWNKKTETLVDLQAITPLALNDALMMDGVFIPFHDDLIIEQSTGLKDKNGKEIFEGDIVRVADVVFDLINNSAKVIWWGRPPEFGLYHNKSQWCEDWNLSDDAERMEVIGNIHENPELLKK